MMQTAAELRKRGIDVKPCPFCGDRDEIQFIDDGVHWPSAECTNCGANIPGDEQITALEAWNLRVAEKK